jgi:hypothetical protein
MASSSTLHEEVLRRFLLGMGLMLLQQPCFQLAKARHLLLFIILNRVIIFEMFLKYFSIKLGFILDSSHFLTTPLNTFFSITIVNVLDIRPVAVAQLWNPRLVISRSRVRIQPLRWHRERENGFKAFLGKMPHCDQSHKRSRAVIYKFTTQCNYFQNKQFLTSFSFTKYL